MKTFPNSIAVWLTCLALALMVPVSAGSQTLAASAGLTTRALDLGTGASVEPSDAAVQSAHGNAGCAQDGLRAAAIVVEPSSESDEAGSSETDSSLVELVSVEDRKEISFSFPALVARPLWTVRDSQTPRGPPHA